MSEKSGTPSSEITDGTVPPCVLVSDIHSRRRSAAIGVPGMSVVVLIRVRRSPPTLPAVGD
jgi:hypothetical protein